MAKKTNKALIFIFITMLVDVTGLGIIIPVIPKLICNMTGCDLSTASKYGGWLLFVYAIMQFFFSPILGNLSDKYGRRPVLLFSLFGFGLDYILMGFAPTVAWLFVGRAIAGITGASFTTAGAYIADVSEPENRAQNFGLIGAAFGIGFIIGPVIGGVLGHIGTRLPFFAAAGLALLNWLYGYFILPESLKLENRREFSWKRANPIGSLSHLKRYPLVLSMVASLVCIYLAGYSSQSTWTYYTMEKFKWSEAQVGYSLGFVGLMIAIVQGGLIRIVIPKLGKKRSVYVGLTLYAIGLLLIAYATEGWMLYVFIIPLGLGGIAGPAIQGIISSQVPSNEQGELQGALTSMVSLTSIVGPLLMTYLFSYFTSANTPVFFPGAPFLMGAILTVMSVLFAMRSLASQPRH